MHGETNNSPRHAPRTVRFATISHISVSNATNTQPKTLKNTRFKVLANFNVARE
jgi:negative regulator of replication initiation